MPRSASNLGSEDQGATGGMVQEVASETYQVMMPSSYNYIHYAYYVGIDQFLTSQEAGTGKGNQTGTAGQCQGAGGGRGPTIIDVEDEEEEE